MWKGCIRKVGHSSSLLSDTFLKNKDQFEYQDQRILNKINKLITGNKILDIIAFR